VVQDGRVTARIAYPVAGLLSDKSPAEVAAEHHAVVEAAGKICTWQPPYRTFKALEGQSLACNPGPHLTDLGMTDGSTKEIRPMLISANSE
jgi:adenine deaminase